MLAHFAFDVYEEGAQPPDYQEKAGQTIEGVN